MLLISHEFYLKLLFDERAVIIDSASILIAIIS